MSLFLLILGMVGVFLSGASMQKASNTELARHYVIGVIEMISGVYFIIVFIGSIVPPP